MSNEITTYEPDNSLKKGYISIVSELISEIIQNRWLTYQLFRRDFFSMYKQSVIGILWVVILPIVNVATFLMLSRSGIFNVGDIRIPYPLYAILGMAFWQIFSTGIIACANSLSNAGDMVKRINFSKKSLVLAAMGKPIVSFFIQLILVAVLFIIYRIFPHPGILLLPFIIIPLILLTLGFGLMVAILNAIIRDTGNFLSVALTLFMYLTPVLYAKPKIGLLAQVTHYNPVYYYISAGRDLALNGQIQELSGFLYSVVFSILIFIFSLIVFHLTETRITERI